MNTPLKPTFFATAAEFRKWLERNFSRASELWVGFYNQASGKSGISYPEAVDEALCFGWIDGIKKRVNADSYTNRFTPRRQRSSWSAVNIRRVGELRRAGRMHSTGLRVFENRSMTQPAEYSYEQRESAVLSRDMEQRFRADAKAWSFFQSQPAGYRTTVTWWVVSAKRQDTRERRLAALMEDSRNGLRIRQFRR